MQLPMPVMQLCHAADAESHSRVGSDNYSRVGSSARRGSLSVALSPFGNSASKRSSDVVSSPSTQRKRNELATCVRANLRLGGNRCRRNECSFSICIFHQDAAVAEYETHQHASYVWGAFVL